MQGAYMAVVEVDGYAGCIQKYSATGEEGERRRMCMVVQVSIHAMRASQNVWSSR